MIRAIDKSLWLSKMGEWYVPEPTTGCWLWLLSTNSHGYGKIKHLGKSAGAYRLSYELLVGPIASGYEIDHLCRTRSCVNPDHMEAVSRRTNTLRGISPAAQHARKTHCIHGHEFTEENTIREGTGRHCRECMRETHRRFRQRHAERLRVYHREWWRKRNGWIMEARP